MYDKEIATEHFSKLLRYKTVSGFEEEFVALRNSLRDMYPNLHKNCEYKLIDGKGMMFRWKGQTSDESIVLMSHYDVVPAREEQWTHPPFSGAISGGKIWGRGAIDTKCTFCSIMESVEALMSKGFTPRADIYLCFGGDEETAGSNAMRTAEELKRRSVKPCLVLDEGGAIVDGKVVGISHPCALIGIAEKGYMDVEFIARGKGGHSSLAGESNPIVVMAEAIRRINGNLFKPHISEPVKIMINAAAKHADFMHRIILRNYRFWGKLLKRFLLKALPEINALTKTLGTITQISGGNAENVIPEQVRAVGNFRVINGSSMEAELGTIKNALTDLDVEINLISGVEPSAISKMEGPGWQALSKAISKFWNGSVLIPYLMLARSDSRSYCEISDNIYRFSPIMLTKTERGSIHGVDENIDTESFYKIIDFYIELITNV